MPFSPLNSFCRAADGHQRADQRPGPLGDPLPGLSHLRHARAVPWHRGPPRAAGAGGNSALQTPPSLRNQQEILQHLHGCTPNVIGCPGVSRLSPEFILTPSLGFYLLPYYWIPLGFSSLVLVYFYFVGVYITPGQQQSRAEQLWCALKLSSWGRGWRSARSIVPGASRCCSLSCPQEGKENAQAFQPLRKHFHLPGCATRSM